MYAVAYRNTERSIRPKLDRRDSDVVVKTYYPRDPKPSRQQHFREDIEKAWAAKKERERLERESMRALIAQYRVIDCTKISAKAIISLVAERHNVAVKDILGPRRAKHIIDARYEAICEVARVRPDMSLPAIGRAFGRDHTTILHALRKAGIPSSSVVRQSSTDRET